VPSITSIWAQTRAGVIGRAGTIPWRYAGDFKRFKRMTMGGVVVMGRKTFESIGHPLAGRSNIVVTSSTLARDQGTDPATRLVTATSVRLAVAMGHGLPVWFIGGARVYAEAMSHVHALDVTIVPDVISSTGLALVYAPAINTLVWRLDSEEPHPDMPTLLLQRWERR
jgi:dihydrofolate reductase